MAAGRQQPSKEAEPCQRGALIEPPFLHVDLTAEDGRCRRPCEEHPGWNITDQITLPPYGECRYVIELVSDQAASIGLASIGPVEVLICDDDDYDCLEDCKSCLEACCVVAETMSERTPHEIMFRAASTGVYDVIVRNPTDECAAVVIRIFAGPMKGNHAEKFENAIHF